MHELKPGRQVRHDKHAGEQLLNGRGQLTWRLDKIKSRGNGTHPSIALAMTGPAARPAGPRGRAARDSIALHPLGRIAVRDDQVSPPGISVAELAQDVGGRADVTDRHRRSRAAECGGDGLGRSVRDRDQLGKRPEHAGKPAAIGEKDLGRVGTPAHGLPERRRPGPEPGALVAELVLGLPQPGQLSRGGLDGRGRTLVRRNQLGPVLVPASELILQFRRIAAVPSRPCARAAASTVASRPASSWAAASRLLAAPA